MNPLNYYNFVPTTVNGNQFLSYDQPASYMTDYRNSSDMYAYLINNSPPGQIRTSHELRQYLQDNGTELTTKFFISSAKQFLNMQVPGAPNTCGGAQSSVIYSGGVPLINSSNQAQMFSQECSQPGEQCIMYWDNTPIPQQGPHCGIPPKNASNPFGLLR